ncbi:hypothetical protein OAW28_05935 [Alphaproteobacteria bacterium]|nr:hypothetical protein [Alphaproteobacteria bacterium]
MHTIIKILVISVLSLFAIVGGVSISKADTENWTMGLYCKSNLPDPKLDSFFIMEEKKKFIRVAEFNNDIVQFSLPPIELQITPKEFFNRPEGLIINRETLEMKWRNSKGICYIKEIETLKQLAQEHLVLLLNNNKL